MAVSPFWGTVGLEVDPGSARPGDMVPMIIRDGRWPIVLRSMRGVVNSMSTWRPVMSAWGGEKEAREQEATLLLRGTVSGSSL